MSVSTIDQLEKELEAYKGNRLTFGIVTGTCVAAFFGALHWGEENADKHNKIRLATIKASNAYASQKFDGQIASALEKVLVVKKPDDVSAGDAVTKENSYLHECADQQMRNAIVIENNMGRSSYAGKFPVDVPALKKCFVEKVTENNPDVIARKENIFVSNAVGVAGGIISLVIGGISVIGFADSHSHVRRKEAFLKGRNKASQTLGL